MQVTAFTQAQPNHYCTLENRHPSPPRPTSSLRSRLHLGLAGAPAMVLGKHLQTVHSASLDLKSRHSS